MRRSPLLLVLATALLLPAWVADAKPKRCGKQTIAVGPKRNPKACVPRTLPARQDLGAAAPARALAKLPKAAKRSRNGEQLARQLLQTVRSRVDAGQPAVPLGAVKAVPRRTAADNDWTFRNPDFAENNGGTITAVWHAEGHEITLVHTDKYTESTARDRNGAGGTIGLGAAHDVPACPTATGDLPAKYQEKMTTGQAGTVHGKRRWFLITLEFDGTWRGHVGVGGKAEKFDVDMRGTIEVRRGVEIAATGKVLKREPTRTYRAALTKQGLPVGVDPATVVRDLRLRGPKGNRVTSEDELRGLSMVGGRTASTVGRISELLEEGDKRWYDNRACAKMDHTSTPAKVKRGGQADWDATVLAHDGTPVADAIWTSKSTCGALSSSGSRGPKTHLTVTDSAGSWSADPSRPACVTADVTSPAGRALLDHSIPAEDSRRYRFDVRVYFRETMGEGITPTNMDGSGSAEAALGEEESQPGTGTYAGTEWDGGVHNPCGEDMSKVRGFSGTATVGAFVRDDGTATVVWTANERPLTMSFLSTIPLTPGLHVVNDKGTHPFCGEAGRGTYEVVMSTQVTPVG